MRYVYRDLVLRLQKPLSPELLEQIRAEFQDILKAGTFEQVGALPEEADEPDLAALPRLRFCFDRHNAGRLRQLIDLINRA